MFRRQKKEKVVDGTIHIQVTLNTPNMSGVHVTAQGSVNDRQALVNQVEDAVSSLAVHVQSFIGGS